MHDMMREICLSKAKEENFLQVMEVPTSTSTINAQTPSRARRLVVHNGNALDMLGHKNKKADLFCVPVEGNLWKPAISVFQSLPLLRVLDLHNAKFKGGKLPSSIGELIHLRFLSLQILYSISSASVSTESKASDLPQLIRRLGEEIADGGGSNADSGKVASFKVGCIIINGFVGKRMVCSKGGFPSVTFSRISNQEELEEWIVEEGSMPCLCSLVIDDCKKLKELPDGLKYITSFKGTGN
ncbi:unnamed protein product [Microthlaspi erraticum]|uniref:Uncharacterized protein n=1 Tax=Microthlaspi erraticum TaxID=1685480 RepID=A0A6D2IRI6_9BRAS|nr:unnamed protein product [Microthlaspi erraticum]